MKSVILAGIAGLLASQTALADPALAGLDCQVFNPYGQSRIHFNAATGDLRLVTNYMIFTAMHIRHINAQPARAELVLDLADAMTKMGYTLTIETSPNAQTPGGSPARLILQGASGAVLGGPAIPSTPPMPIAIGTCKYALR